MTGMAVAVLAAGLLAAMIAGAQGIKMQMRTHALELAHIRALHAQQKLLADGQNGWEAVLSKDSGLLSMINATIGGQTFALALDTGSANTWVTTTECDTETCSSHARFDPALSSTLVRSENKDQVIYITFGTGKIEATLAKDTVAIGTHDSLAIQHQDILLVRDQSGAVFDTPAFSGLIGLGFDSLAANGTTPIVDNLVALDELKDPQFYFFLGPHEQFFAIGKPKDFVDQYTGNDLKEYPIIEQHYWTVALDDVLFNGESLLSKEQRKTACPGGKCKLAFDSGSTLNTMPLSVYAELVSRHRTSCKAKSNPHFPLGNGTLTYVINGDEYVFQSEDFNSDAEMEEDNCPTLLLEALDVSNRYGPLFIAGRVFLRRYLAVFQHGKTPSMALAPLNTAYKPPTSLREAVLSQIRL